MADIKEKLGQGYIQNRVIIEVAGKPKEHVSNTLKGYIENIKQSKDIEIINESINEAEKAEAHGKDLFAAFAEIEMLSKDISTLVGFCLDYMPSSIEIIAPSEIKMKESELSLIMNDLQGKLHKLDMGAKQLRMEIQFLQRNAFFLATNLVSVLLKSGAKTLGDLSRLSGMSEKDMKDFLEKLSKKGFVKEEDESYIWVKDRKKE